MPTADGRFLGLSVPAEAWERIFGAKPEACDHFFRPIRGSTAHIGAVHCVHCDKVRYDTLPSPGWNIRAAYEEHLNVIGPDDASPFIQTFRR